MTGSSPERKYPSSDARTYSKEVHRSRQPRCSKKAAIYAKRSGVLYADSRSGACPCEQFVLIYLNAQLLGALRLFVKQATRQVKLDRDFKSSESDEMDAPGAAALTNLAVGWGSMAIGALTGLILGLWSFGGPVPVPDLLGEYDALPRRLMRLGHIAFFGLGILNILMAVHLGRLKSGDSHARLALIAMNFGNIFLPLTLVCAAFFEPLKYLMSLPAAAVTFALIISAWVAIHRARKEQG